MVNEFLAQHGGLQCPWHPDCIPLARYELMPLAVLKSPESAGGGSFSTSRKQMVSDALRRTVGSALSFPIVVFRGCPRRAVSVYPDRSRQSTVAAGPPLRTGERRTIPSSWHVSRQASTSSLLCGPWVSPTGKRDTNLRKIARGRRASPLSLGQIKLALWSTFFRELVDLCVSFDTVNIASNK
ncbi:hypothetical protein PAXRUDRAFT_479357 [Paxillus rubicundulus Ve08.2h10]|uniref:Uncharacterized protein n=1 Tax=Paxillus rubicundulus Ve08.2h10 TaxID=930991 RepID=A0A0D0E7I7_9AGAM|nr:hypothetical protein PAXRUDRAFT_479357 [Paxillus rubicundulus Ve08.2h10]